MLRSNYQIKELTKYWNKKVMKVDQDIIDDAIKQGMPPKSL
jgi:hypothetical protein